MKRTALRTNQISTYWQKISSKGMGLILMGTFLVSLSLPTYAQNFLNDPSSSGPKTPLQLEEENFADLMSAIEHLKQNKIIITPEEGAIVSSYMKLGQVEESTTSCRKEQKSVVSIGNWKAITDAVAQGDES